MPFDRTRIKIEHGNQATLAAYSNMIVYNARAKRALTRGVWGHAPPPEKFQIFSSSEVDFEPVSANFVVEPRTLGRPLHFRLPTEFCFGELEFAWLVRMMANCGRY